MILAGTSAKDLVPKATERVAEFQKRFDLERAALTAAKTANDDLQRMASDIKRGLAVVQAARPVNLDDVQEAIDAVDAAVAAAQNKSNVAASTRSATETKLAQKKQAVVDAQATIDAQKKTMDAVAAQLKQVAGSIAKASDAESKKDFAQVYLSLLAASADASQITVPSQTAATEALRNGWKMLKEAQDEVDRVNAELARATDVATGTAAAAQQAIKSRDALVLQAITKLLDAAPENPKAAAKATAAVS